MKSENGIEYIAAGWLVEAVVQSEDKVHLVHDGQDDGYYVFEKQWQAQRHVDTEAGDLFAHIIMVDCGPLDATGHYGDHAYLEQTHAVPCLIVDGDRKTDMNYDKGLPIVHVDDICEPFDGAENTEIHRNVNWMQTRVHVEQEFTRATTKLVDLALLEGRLMVINQLMAGADIETLAYAAMGEAQDMVEPEAKEFWND